MRLNLQKVRTVRMTMMKIPETEAEIQKVDGVQQEERKILEVSGHQRVVQADPAEVPVILPEKAVVAAAKEIGQSEMTM